MWLWNCSSNLALFVSLLDFGTVPTVWHYLFFDRTLELFRQCEIICFSIGLWNCSDSVALFFALLYFGTVLKVWSIICFSLGLWNYSQSVALLVYLLDFGTDQRVWHYLFYYWTVELFRQCGIIVFSFFYWALELLRQCGIIGFSMGLWNCFDSVPLFGFLLDFGSVPRLWHYLFFHFTLEQFRNCGIICFSTECIVCFSIGLWNCSDNVTLFVFLMDFAIVLTVGHYLFL